jgi:hypothetical protein
MSASNLLCFSENFDTMTILQCLSSVIASTTPATTDAA